MNSPAHPGRIVKGALDDLDVSVTGAAAALNVARPMLPLSKAVGSSPGFWHRLQMNFDLAQVEQRADEIEVTPIARRAG
jgi:antitoxin HigA-1